MMREEMTCREAEEAWNYSISETCKWNEENVQALLWWNTVIWLTSDDQIPYYSVGWQYTIDIISVLLWSDETEHYIWLTVWLLKRQYEAWLCCVESVCVWSLRPDYWKTIDILGWYYKYEKYWALLVIIVYCVL